MILSCNIHRYPPIPPPLLPGSLGLRLPVLYLENYSALTSPVEMNVGVVINLSGIYAQTFITVALHEAE